MVQTAGQALWGGTAEDDDEADEDCKKAEGDEGELSGEEAVGHPCLPGLFICWQFMLHWQRVGGEGVGLDGKGVRLEEHHWAGVGVDLHRVHAAVVVEEEGLW